MKSSKLFVIAAIGAVAFSSTGCSTSSPAADQIALHYKGGPFSAKKFSNCDDSGTRKVHGPADKMYYYPKGQRTFEFKGNGDGVDAPAFEVVSKDNIEMTVSGILTFNLDTACDEIRKFHEQIGLKKQAYMDEDGTNSAGWSSMLRAYMGNALQQALNDATQVVGYKTLYNDPEAKRAWELAVIKSVPDKVKTLSGGDWFKNIGITIQKPGLPQKVLDALASAQVSVAQNDAQTQKNKQIETQIISLKELVKVLGPYGAILYQAIQDGKITILPLPTGSNLNLPVPSK